MPVLKQIKNEFVEIIHQINMIWYGNQDASNSLQKEIGSNYNTDWNFERQENHTLRSQQMQMQHAEHFCQDNSSKQLLYDLEMSQSSHQSHHYEALDLYLQNKPIGKRIIQ